MQPEKLSIFLHRESGDEQNALWEDYEVQSIKKLGSMEDDSRQREAEKSLIFISICSLNLHQIQF